MTPEVSVVMSVYNGAAHLIDTLNSILSQRDCSFEFIVVNDGSIDASGAILQEFAARDVRVRVFHQLNGGLTRALQRGCAEARGDFIARQDCGDLAGPSRLALQLFAIKKDPRLSFVSCATRYATEEGGFLYQTRGTGVAAIPTKVIDLSKPHGVVDGPTHHGSVMFCRETYLKVGGYRPEFYFGQDWDLWYRLAEHGHFQTLQEMLYEARLGVADISMNNKAGQEMISEQSLQALRLRLAGLSDQPAVNAAALIRPGGSLGGGTSHGTWRGCYFMGECLRRNGNREAALRYLSRAVRENPMHLKSWVRLFQARFG